MDVRHRVQSQLAPTMAAVRRCEALANVKDRVQSQLAGLRKGMCCLSKDVRHRVQLQLADKDCRPRLRAHWADVKQQGSIATGADNGGDVPL